MWSLYISKSVHFVGPFGVAIHNRLLGREVEGEVGASCNTVAIQGLCQLYKVSVNINPHVCLKCEEKCVFYSQYVSDILHKVVICWMQLS